MKKILVVDDDPDFLNLIEHGLKANNYKPYFLYETKYILQEIMEIKPDAILLDIQQRKNVNGLNIYTTLKESGKVPHTPIILISGLELTEKDLQALGGALFLKKPFTVAELKTLLESVMAPGNSPA